MKAKLFRPAVFALLSLLLVAGFLSGCQKATNSSANGAGSSQGKSSAKPRTDFEEKLQYVRDGQFHYIYVFTRKDIGPFDKDDVAYLTANSPVGEKTNMRVKTEDGTRVIIGTNFEFTQANFDALAQRFNIENYTGK